MYNQLRHFNFDSSAGWTKISIQKASTIHRFRRKVSVSRCVVPRQLSRRNYLARVLSKLRKPLHFHLWEFPLWSKKKKLSSTIMQRYVASFTIVIEIISTFSLSMYTTIVLCKNYNNFERWEGIAYRLLLITCTFVAYYVPALVFLISCYITVIFSFNTNCIFFSSIKAKINICYLPPITHFIWILLNKL